MSVTQSVMVPQSGSCCAHVTGAVKITPAHDPNDFMVGKRHNLEFINILDDNGNINDNGGSFKGQPRFQVSDQLILLV